MIKKMRSYFAKSPSMRLLLLEAFVYLAWARLLKQLPFAKIADSLGRHMEETAYIDHPKNVRVVKQISRAVYTMSRYTFWESQCLVQAIAALKMLERRKIDSTLYLGTAKNDQGELIAHAWLRSGPVYVTGADSMQKFVVVSRFAKRIGKKESLKGSAYEQ